MIQSPNLVCKLEMSVRYIFQQQKHRENVYAQNIIGKHRVFLFFMHDQNISHLAGVLTL